MRITGWSIGAAAIAVALSSSCVFAQSTPMFGLAGVTVEGVVLQRGGQSEALLTKVDDTNGSIFGSSTTFTPVKYNDLDPEVAGGLRLKFDGWFFGQRTVYSVLGAWGFDGSLFRTGMQGGPGTSTDATYELPGADVYLGNSDVIDAIRADFKSSLYSTDSAGYWFGGAPDRPGFNFIAGTRTIVLDERLKTTVYDDPGTSTDIDRVKLEVGNFATGVQIGIDGYTYFSPGLKVGGFIKGGLLANFVDVDSRFSSNNNAANRLKKSYDSTEFAQFVELSGRVSYEVAPNLELTGSAMLLYVNGIAEAGDQFSNVADSAKRHIDANSDALFYGGTLGLTYKFN
jgi:hypothetical protein